MAWLSFLSCTIFPSLDLTEVLSPQSCIVIYPEGTRFSEKKRRSQIQRLEEQNSPDLAYAKQLQCVLPPKKGGSLGLIDKKPETPVVFIAHLGFDTVSNISNLVNGRLFQQKIFCAFWKKQAPTDVEQREEWLQQQWLELDRWLVDKQQKI